MSNVFKTSVLVAVTALSSSCASIVSDSEYLVCVDSEPKGADVLIRSSDGEVVFSGSTPTYVALDAGASYFQKETYTLAFKKDGYTDQQNILQAKFDGWYVGNIGFGGLIGLLIVDPLTGSMWKLPKASYTCLSKNETEL